MPKMQLAGQGLCGFLSQLCGVVVLIQHYCECLMRYQRLVPDFKGLAFIMDCLVYYLTFNLV